MIYLKIFKLLDEDDEHNIVFYRERRNIFNSYYPLGIFSTKGLFDLSFENITIFYGGNGSGKTTLLNIISEKLGAIRKSNVEKGSFFDKYVDSCTYDLSFERPVEIKVITSDDVFDYLLDVRAINGGVNRRKEFLSSEYSKIKLSKDISSFDNYEEVKKFHDAKTQTVSRYVRERLTNNNIALKSNGESSLMFWEREIREDGIYILDEPENSLSAENQLKLKQFIEDSARFYNCQFIISTHSPFLLDLMEAKIYDLDENPVSVKVWSELSNVKLYYDFFKKREGRFKDE